MTHRSSAPFDIYTHTEEVALSSLDASVPCDHLQTRTEIHFLTCTLHNINISASIKQTIDL